MEGEERRGIITIEGSDCTGKTSAFLYLSELLRKEKSITFNEGPIYPTELTSKLLSRSTQTNNLDKERLYTTAYMIDKIEWDKKNRENNRIIIQDRYWPSVVSYGKFLNQKRSIHANENFIPFFLMPSLAIRLKCSLEEKIRRCKERGKNSTIDRYLLEDDERIRELNIEIDKSLKDIPVVYEIDTTDKSIEEVALGIKNYLGIEGYLG